MRKQYHFRRSGEDMLIWDVDRLITMSEKIETTKLHLDQIKSIDENYWFQNDDDIPSVREIVGHLNLMEKSDLSYPILITKDGRVIDGMHRVLKALIQKEKHIKAKVFNELPEPDFINKHPDELKYD